MLPNVVERSRGADGEPQQFIAIIHPRLLVRDNRRVVLVARANASRSERDPRSLLRRTKLVYGTRRRRLWSATGELRVAAFEESGDAFAVVVGALGDSLVGRGELEGVR